MNLRKTWFKFRHPFIDLRIELLQSEIEIMEQYIRDLEATRREYSFLLLEVLAESAGFPLPASLTKDRVERDGDVFTVLNPIGSEPPCYVFDEQNYPMEKKTLSSTHVGNHSFYEKDLTRAFSMVNEKVEELRELIIKYNYPEETKHVSA